MFLFNMTRYTWRPNRTCCRPVSYWLTFISDSISPVWVSWFAPTACSDLSLCTWSSLKAPRARSTSRSSTPLLHRIQNVILKKKNKTKLQQKNPEGSLSLSELRSVWHPRGTGRTPSALTWTRSKRPVTEECEQICLPGLKHTPPPPIAHGTLRVYAAATLKCDALSGSWLTLQYTVKKTKKKVPTPSPIKRKERKKKCRTPTKQAHMYHVQGLSSNISLNGMPHFQPEYLPYNCTTVSGCPVEGATPCQLLICVPSCFIFAQIFTICDVQGFLCD